MQSRRRLVDWMEVEGETASSSSEEEEECECEYNGRGVVLEDAASFWRSDHGSIGIERDRNARRESSVVMKRRTWIFSED